MVMTGQDGVVSEWNPAAEKLFGYPAEEARGRHIDDLVTNLELRAEAPHATVRLSRLTEGRPGADLDVGWLLELELAEGEPLLAGHRLADSLRDMRLLGLQPTLLAPRGTWTNGRAA